MTWMTIRLMLVAGGSFGATVIAAQAATIKPGYWESTSRVTAPISTTKTERRCITPAAVARFVGCYVNHHYKCTCPEQSYTGGQIQFRGDCVDAKGRHVLIEGDGAYTATTLQMTARGRFNLMGLEIPFSASTDSHRIGDVCPAGSPGSEQAAR